MPDRSSAPRPRLKAHWFHVLVVLGQGARHGSAIAREVFELTEGEVNLWPASLYGALDELVARGWIEELVGSRRPPDAGERRRYYQLNGQGRRVLAEETEKLKRLVATARRAVARSPAR